MVGSVRAWFVESASRLTQTVLIATATSPSAAHRSDRSRRTAACSQILRRKIGTARLEYEIVGLTVYVVDKYK